MKIKRVYDLTPTELKTIVNLHYQALNESFLNNFGKAFLSIVYQNIPKSKDNIVLLLQDNRNLCGNLPP